MLLPLFSQLLLLYRIPTVAPATCPFHIDGVKCTQNQECPSNMRCFFGNDDPIGYGYCCQVKDHGYYNAMFYEQMDDPDARLPVEMLEPVRDDPCDNSIDCVYPEVCMVSRIRGNNTQIPPNLSIHGVKQIPKHCYKKFSYWPRPFNSYSIQFCNNDSDCSNNNCITTVGKLMKTKISRVWKTEKIVIYHPLFQGLHSRTVEKAELIMEEMDEIDERSTVWIMHLKDANWYNWRNGSDWTNCFFSFKGKRLMDNPKTPIKIRQAKLTCHGLDEDLYEDLEIFGANIRIQTEIVQYDGLCGHPNLNCSKCFINNKLYKCKEDKDCYKVAGHDWTNRNEKTFCSEETYNGTRLCKRELFTCPPDSLNSDGTTPKKGPCLEDIDCKDMQNFTNLAAVNETYSPHCFKGVCCARRPLCSSSSHEFPYALPLELNSLQDQIPCHSNDDCNMFPDTHGTCVFDESVRKVFELREDKYLESQMITKKNLYGMCCYTKENACVRGGHPLRDDFAPMNCKSQKECNPELAPYEWTAYCSSANETNSCCRDERPNIFCPDSFTPFRTEPECTEVNSDIEFSGSCPEGKESGMCYRGHCCPQLRIDHLHNSDPSDSDYLTVTSCDPTQPLPDAYQWAYCDPETERIMVMGSKKPNGEKLDWQRKRCTVNSDCEHPDHLCIHKYHGIRLCVTPPSRVRETNDHYFWTLISIIVACFIGIIIIVLFMPTPLFR